MLHGSSISDLDELGERLFVQQIQKRIYPEMRELVRAHMARGHTVVLSSSALTVQVEPVARFLGIDNILSNKFETDEDGLITGEVITPIIWGPGKARAVQAFAAENGVDLAKSYFYADGDEDVALMYLVGNPRPTNPAGKLEAVAPSVVGRCCRFNSRSGSSPVAQLRTAAGIASLVPAAAGAIGLGLLTRNRRTGVNFFTSTWSRLLMTVDRHRPERHRRGEPDGQAACGVPLQPPQPGRPVHRGPAGQRQLHRRSARRSSRRTR